MTTKTLYEVMNDHADMKGGTWTFRESGNQYKNVLGPRGTRIVVPIIDNIERRDQRIQGLPADVYAVVLKREGIIR